MSQEPCLEKILRSDQTSWTPVLVPCGNGFLASMLAPGPCPVDAERILTFDELVTAAKMSSRRRAEWVGGRICLFSALNELGLFAHCTAPATRASILVALNGAPIIPEGGVGSLSHKARVIVCLAGVDHGHRIGIDLEFIVGSEEQLASRVLTPSELKSVEEVAPSMRAKAVAIHFSLKESIYKALPMEQQPIVDFHDIEILDWEPVDDSVLLNVSAQVCVNGTFAQVCGTVETLSKWILTTARIPWTPVPWSPERPRGAT